MDGRQCLDSQSSRMTDWMWVVVLFSFFLSFNGVQDVSRRFSAARSASASSSHSSLISLFSPGARFSDTVIRIVWVRSSGSSSKFSCVDTNTMLKMAKHNHKSHDLNGNGESCSKGLQRAAHHKSWTKVFFREKQTHKNVFEIMRPRHEGIIVHVL